MEMLFWKAMWKLVPIPPSIAAQWGIPIIRKGTKIDNLVQIAHNCDIGEHNVFAGQVGISGSTKVGNYNKFAGQVGLGGAYYCWGPCYLGGTVWRWTECEK